MSNATIVPSGPSLLHQYLAIKCKEGLNVLITSMNTSIFLLIFAVIVACVRWCKKRPWRSLKIYSYINMLLSLTMYNALKMFLNFLGPVPKTFLIDFLTRLSVSSFTLWFMMMSWSTFATTMYPIFWSCVVASALGWISVVGYSALFAYLGGLFPFTVVAVALSYSLHVVNVYTIIKILINKNTYPYLCEVLRMLLYSTDAFIILVCMHVSQYVPEWSDIIWVCILAVQVISPIVFICTGECRKLYHILLDKDNNEKYMEERNFEFQIIYHKRYICPVIVCYYDVEVIGQPTTSQMKARCVPCQDGQPKPSKAGHLPSYYQDGQPKPSKPENLPSYYQDGQPKPSKPGNLPSYYQDGQPKPSKPGNLPSYYQDGQPKPSKPGHLPSYYQDGKPKPSIAKVVPYYQDCKPFISNAKYVPYNPDGKPNASNATDVPYYDEDDQFNASNVTSGCECHQKDTKF